MASSPLVSIVTPCLNAAPFIAETLSSVLSQDYPHVEYLILDGGSTDGTLAILERFEQAHPGRFRYLSERDGGAAAALARGFSLAAGEILAYLNADDLYLPGAIAAAVAHLQQHPEAAVVYGRAFWIDAIGHRLGDYPTLPFDRDALARECFLCQPAAFFRAAAYREADGIDPGLQSAFDYDLWLRLSRRHPFAHLEKPLAASRMHSGNKTLAARRAVFSESIAAVRRHTGYVPFQWVHGYASYLLDRRDQYFSPLRPSFTKYLFSLFLGTLINWSRPFRFWAEWASVMSPAAFRRRWHDTWLARHLGI